ncbi:hypothetical protein [Pendulispora albinea]|uniref:Uncharacterized protein n=1 Tax=Pendulispora albinea TaxID=2741071 RepID=A0ABZ2MBA3_9BACT
MITLSLADTETVIQAAFNRWLDHDPSSFTIRVGGHEVRVNIELRDQRFDCGTPGYNMRNADVPALRQWVPLHIKNAGAVGGLAPCKNVGDAGQVNAVLRVSVMFNFHVNLVNPCDASADC